MATIGSAQKRCINCKREVKDDQEFCKCGDRVMARPNPRRSAVRLEIEDFEQSGVPSARLERELASSADGKTTAEPNVLAARVAPAEVTTAKPAVQLTTEQESALDAVTDWYAARGIGIEPFRLFGPAGTGKTTLAKHIEHKLGIPGGVVFGAYTGKAAHVLRKKGVPATTIHSAIYKPVENREARARWERATRELEELREMTDLSDQELAVKAELEQEVTDLEQAIKQGVSFELNPLAEWGSADLIVLDEVSMVNERLALDIESFGVPVLVLGDPFQLPPVEGGGYYTNVKPDVLLQEVHRQALESPVLHLATDVRFGMPWRKHLVKVNLADAMAADQILCWKNSTRINLTSRIREKLGRPAGSPVPGDRVMCLVNNKDIGVFNGQQFEVLNTFNDRESMLLRDDEGNEVQHYFDPDGFRGLDGEKEAKARRRHSGRVGLFTFANVITVHKSQGSEWPHVYVVDQTEQMWKSSATEKARWMYTAITRASDRITIASTAVR